MKNYRKKRYDESGVAAPLEFTLVFGVLFTGFILMFVSIGPILEPYNPTVSKANLENAAAIIAEHLVDSPGYDYAGNTAWDLDPDNLSYLGLALPKPISDTYYYDDGTVEIILNDVNESSIDLAVTSLSYSPNTNLVHGQDITVNFTVSNLLTDKSEGFNYTVNINNTVQKKDSRFVGLPGKGSVDFSVDATIPNDANVRYTLVVAIFPYGEDDDLTNNYLTARILIGSPIPPDPNPTPYNPPDSTWCSWNVSAEGPTSVTLNWRRGEATDATTYPPDPCFYKLVSQNVTYSGYVREDDNNVCENTNPTPTSDSRTVTFSGEGTYTYTFSATDDYGVTKTASVTTVITVPPKPTDCDDPCFLANTKIKMADDSIKNIQDIKIGDSVKSFDTTDNAWKTGTVSEVFHHSPSEMTDYYLVINNDLKVTPNHPFYVDNQWITAGDLKVGDNFGTGVISIEKVYERVPTFNFEVLPYHTYNVVWSGSSSSVVHNPELASSGGTIPPVGDKNPCFLANTKVKMADGSLKNIQDIKAGEFVKGFDEKNNTWKNTKVVKALHHTPEEMTDYYLVINNELKVTPNHLLYTNDRWTEAGNIKIGDFFPGGLAVKSIEKVYERVPTFNLECFPYHNYNVVINGGNVLAHNATAEGMTSLIPNGKTTTNPTPTNNPSLSLSEGLTNTYTYTETNTNGGVSTSGINIGGSTTALSAFLKKALGYYDGSSFYGPANSISIDSDSLYSSHIQTKFNSVYNATDNEKQSTTHYTRCLYSGKTPDGRSYIRELITDNQQTDYALVDAHKIYTLDSYTVPYETVKTSLLGGSNLPSDLIGNVDFNIRITTLDGTELMDYGKSYNPSSSSIITQYNRVITIYKDKTLESFGYDGNVPAVLEVKVFT